MLVRLGSEHVKRLMKRFHAEGNPWLGLNYHFFFTWLEENFKLTNIVFNRNTGEVIGHHPKNCAFTTFLLLNS